MADMKRFVSGILTLEKEVPVSIYCDTPGEWEIERKTDEYE